MKILKVDNIPVLPPSEQLAAADRQLQEQLSDLDPLTSGQVSEASEAWAEHRKELGIDNILRPAFGKPTGPGDKLIPYAQAIRHKRLERR